MAKKDDVINTVPIQPVQPEGNGNGHNGHDEITDEERSILERAKVILVNHLTNTPDVRMPETTYLSRRIVVPLSIAKTFAEWDNYSNAMLLKLGKRPKSFIQQWMQNYFALQRSVGGMHKKDLVMLAENQLIEDEQMGHEDDTP